MASRHGMTMRSRQGARPSPLKIHRSNFGQMEDCTVCLESKDGGHITHLGKDDDLVCHDCVRHIFEAALHSENSYPPTFGPLKLKTKHFVPAVLSPDFMLTFEKKEKEYLTPPKERIYCTWPDMSKNGKGKEGDLCNHFLAPRVKTADDYMRSHNETLKHCFECAGLTCLACGDRISDRSSKHICTATFHAADSEAAAFEGLKRGKDYQLCPSSRCGRRVELSDGCNHIFCMCGMQFCFICGEPTAANSGHWSKSRGQDAPCPRYNQPDAPNAHWDEDRDRFAQFDDIFAHMGHHHAVHGHGQQRFGPRLVGEEEEMLRAQLLLLQQEEERNFAAERDLRRARHAHDMTNIGRRNAVIPDMTDHDEEEEQAVAGAHNQDTNTTFGLSEEPNARIAAARRHRPRVGLGIRPPLHLPAPPAPEGATAPRRTFSARRREITAAFRSRFGGDVPETEEEDLGHGDFHTSLSPAPHLAQSVLHASNGAASAERQLHEQRTRNLQQSALTTVSTNEDLLMPGPRPGSIWQEGFPALEDSVQRERPPTSAPRWRDPASTSARQSIPARNMPPAFEEAVGQFPRLQPLRGPPLNRQRGFATEWDTPNDDSNRRLREAQRFMSAGEDRTRALEMRFNHVERQRRQGIDETSQQVDHMRQVNAERVAAARRRLMPGEEDAMDIDG